MICAIISRQKSRDPPRVRSGHLCESCWREVATEVLYRRQKQIRQAQILGLPLEPEVSLCHTCWLAILCSLKLVPSQTT